jgi:hypothetical protein
MYGSLQVHLGQHTHSTCFMLSVGVVCCRGAGAAADWDAGGFEPTHQLSTVMRSPMVTSLCQHAPCWLLRLASLAASYLAAVVVRHIPHLAAASAYPSQWAYMLCHSSAVCQAQQHTTPTCHSSQLGLLPTLHALSMSDAGLLPGHCKQSMWCLQEASKTLTEAHGVPIGCV